MKVVIVGGVAGGATAAARIRRLDEQAEVIVFEKSGYISYANCGLPYYIGDVITDKEELTLQTPKGFWDRFRVDVRVLHEVIKINADSKTVTVKNLSNGEVFDESYDKLLLATGAKPTKPNMDGIESDQIFTLRNVEDTFKIKEYININKPKSATIVGGGYVGIEMAENLRALGLEVTLVEYADHILAPLDFDMATFVHAKMEENGVKLMLNTEVKGFYDNYGQILSGTTKGDVLSDMVILSVGVTPDTRLAKDAGIALGIKDSVKVNDKMETSIPDIYAVGDAVEVKHFVTNQQTLISLAGPANKQGRIAADNICGGNSTYKGSQGSSVIKIFDMTVATTGINETQAKAAKIDYEKVVLSPMSHASYYPNGQVMTIKVLFDKNTQQILGGQIVGYEGVDKRIDVLATAMRCKMKASALAELDLAYAPPYSSAKDPINMAGFMIENIVTGQVKQFHYEDMDKLPRDGSVVLLDTRTPAEYQRGNAEGFVNIPIDELRERLGEIPKGKPVYVMCQSGLRSYLSARILSLSGFDCYNFAGGYRFYDVIRRGRASSNSVYPCGMEK
ncbi:MAG: CoA-disulfide reductase [Eubacteriales bacterium]|nr:CoA-disulfide reductase [Eubacteriales bacterium]